MKRREAKSKGEKERYTHLNAEFQRIARSKPWAQQPLPILCSPSGASHWPQVAKTKSEVKIPWESRGQSLREQRGRRVDLERQV